MSYKVVEIFESINGEGMKAGELSVFIRSCRKGTGLPCEKCNGNGGRAFAAGGNL